MAVDLNRKTVIIMVCGKDNGYILKTNTNEPELIG